ncbi:MAG: hypothetical protein NT142_05570 [Planctomycetota bacterium]|nr:hypothetical protein [Planctomycetota bacterium]
MGRTLGPKIAKLSPRILATEGISFEQKRFESKLVMLFLKYVSDVWQDHYEAVKKEYGDDEERILRRQKKGLMQQLLTGKVRVNGDARTVRV